MRLLGLAVLLVPVAALHAQPVHLSVAAFTTPEATASARADGTTIEARVSDAFAAWQAVLDSAATGSARALSAGAHALLVAGCPEVRLVRAC